MAKKIEMDVVQKIGCAAFESCNGGGGFPKFADRAIAIMPDWEKALFAKKLSVAMPALTEKFTKITKYEAWWLTLLVEHRWRARVSQRELKRLCLTGVADTNVTPDRLERNLHNLLETCAPGWELVATYIDDEKVWFYQLGDLDVARENFLARHPNATWPEIDEDAMAARDASDALEQEAKAKKDAPDERLLKTWPEVKGWVDKARNVLREAESRLKLAEKANRGGPDNDPALVQAQENHAQAQAALKKAGAAQLARQRVQVKRLEDGLPMYGPDEGPELLGAASNLGTT